MKYIVFFLIYTSFYFVLPVSYAEELNSGETNMEEKIDKGIVEFGDKGYWWYKDKSLTPLEQISRNQKKDDKKEKKQKKKKEPSKKERCLSSWEPGCGFVTPKSFEEQSRMRDHLLHEAYMHPKDVWKVEQWQKYLKWVIDQSIQMVATWKYNQLQNSSLDPSVSSPIGSMGLQLAAGMKEQTEKELWDLIRSMGGKIYVFTKGDCEWCHKQLKREAMYTFDKHVKLPIIEASLDGHCVNTNHYKCVVGDLAVKAGQVLNVKTVPTMFIHFPKTTWIKVSQGFRSIQYIRENIKTYFFAWRMAAIKGLTKANSKNGIVKTNSGDVLDLTGTGDGHGYPKQKEILLRIKKQIEQENNR